MSLRERLKSKKDAKATAQKGEYVISIAKVSNAVNKIKNPADLGNIVKEFSKFLNTLETQNARIVFSGDFDLGQRTLLNCILGNFLDDGAKAKQILSDAIIQDEQGDSSNIQETKISKRRKTIRERLAAKTETDDE